MFTWNSAETIVTDEYGNSASTFFFGSKEDAKAALASCENCQDCVNCRNCYGCERCRNCSDCNDCESCITCNHCIECNYCHSCSGCKRCQNCQRCRMVENCHTVLILGNYRAHFVPNRIIIGCQDHSLHKWRNFQPMEISCMAYDALEWWTKYKSIILLTAEIVSKE